MLANFDLIDLYLCNLYNKLSSTKINDYLIYIFRKNYVLVREFPSMKLVMALNPTRENRNEELTMISLSSEQKNLFILEQNNNKIYIVNQKGFL